MPVLPFLPAIVSGVGSIGGGIAGGIAAGNEQQQAAAARQKAVQALEQIGIPSVEAQQLVLQNPEMIGQFAPEAVTAEQLGPSGMENVQVNPQLKEAQMSALRQLQEQGTNPLTDIEKASLNEARRQTAGDEQARQKLILQQMAERGAGGSGAELAARLASSQGSADRAAQESDRMKAMAQQRALDAIAQAGALGGQIRGQEFGEEAQKASAMDAIARFNAQNRQDVSSSNVAARNAAALREAEMRQQLENLRATNANAQQQYNKQLLQTRFQNEMDKAKGVSNAYTGQADQHQKNAEGIAQSGSQIGNAVGQVGSQIVSQYTQPKYSADTGKKIQKYDPYTGKPIN